MFVPVMWAVWGLILLATVAVKIYKGRMAFDEDDQIFLDDSFEHERSAQLAIAAKVKKIEPIQNALLWVLAAASLFVIGYYVVDILNQLKA
jgi:hypothetical protein